MTPSRLLRRISRSIIGHKYFSFEHIGKDLYPKLPNRSFSLGFENYDKDFFDVVIVGSGMIGSSLACGLACGKMTRGLKVALVDAKGFLYETPKSESPDTYQMGSKPNNGAAYSPDPRTVALSPSSVDFLKEIGVWENVDKNFLGSFEKMQVWNSGGSGFVRYDSNEINKPVLGHVIENKNLMVAIQKQLKKSENLEMIFPALVNEVQWPSSEKSKVEIILEKLHTRSQTKLTDQVASNEKIMKDINFNDGSNNLVEETDHMNKIHESGSDFLKIFLNNNRVLKTRLLVGADGKNSTIRSLAKIRSLGYSYNQYALITNVQVDSSQNDTAWQIFLPNGPLALLPLHKNFCNIVYSTTEKEANLLKSLPDNKFVETINKYLRSPRKAEFIPSTSQASSSSNSTFSALPSKALSYLFSSSRFSDFLNTLKNDGYLKFPSESARFVDPPVIISASGAQRLSFPLGLSVASTFVLPRCALIGDSAHAVHPLAGQGANLGFSDAQQLFKNISRGVELGEDIGNESLLGEYEKERMFMSYGMVLVLDGLHKIFKSQSGIIKFGRNFGLDVFNNGDELKKLAMSFAMGKSVF